MKEILKKIAIASSGVTLLAGTAFASVGNNGTGENSENYVDWMNRIRTNITTDNHGTVTNNVCAEANSGWNMIFGSNSENHNHDEHNHDEEDNNENRGDASIDTGDANARADVTNRVNTTEVSVTKPSSNVGDVGNMNTGKNSLNDVDATMKNTVNVTTNNSATVTNNVNVTANTGHNMINGGGSGDRNITTGSATATANVSNNVNSTTVNVK